jgi:hypothetical protein
MTNNKEVETVNYIHKSNPEKITIVPEEFAKKAEGLVKYILETGGDINILDKIKDNPELFDVRVVNDMARLAKKRGNLGSSQALKLQDSLYLNVCILCLEGIYGMNSYQRYGLDVLLRGLNKDVKSLGLEK